MERFHFSALDSALHRLWHGLKQWGATLFPGRCLLCGENSLDSLICRDCSADLPRTQGVRCPCCALPIAETAQGAVRCPNCERSPPRYDEVFAAFDYFFPVDRLIQGLKYGHQLPLAAWFAQQLAAMPRPSGARIMLPMPLHRTRIRQRGFNQAQEIARHLAQQWEMPLDGQSLIRQRDTPSQVNLSRQARLSNLRGAFECTRDFSGQHLILVDDVVTSGSSVNACADVLKYHGATRVSVVTVARAQWTPAQH